MAEYMEIDDHHYYNHNNNNNKNKSPIGNSFGIRVTSYLRKVLNQELGQQDDNYHKLLITAVHAVLLESGFVAFDPVSNTVLNGFPWPNNGHSGGFSMSVVYTLPNDNNAGGVGSVVLKYENVGTFLNVYGRVCDGVGCVYSTPLDEDELVPMLNVVWAENCGLFYEFLEVDECFGKVFEFWKNVKDRMVLPLLVDLYDNAGLNFLSCFTGLPGDVKFEIVRRLPRVDVARLGCVCVELRDLTSRGSDRKFNLRKRKRRDNISWYD